MEPRWNKPILNMKQFWNFYLKSGSRLWRPELKTEWNKWIVPGQPNITWFLHKFQSQLCGNFRKPFKLSQSPIHPRPVHLINWKITKTNLISGNNSAYPSAAKKIKIIRIKGHFYHLRQAAAVCLKSWIHICGKHIWGNNKGATCCKEHVFTVVSQNVKTVRGPEVKIEALAYYISFDFI